MNQVTRPSGVNVGVNNPGVAVYIKGNERTDGSIRFMLQLMDTEITIEERTEGVWNPTGLRVSASTLFLDRQTSLSGIGVNLQINDLLSVSKFLVACVPFNDSGSGSPQAQVIAPRIDNFSIQSVFDTEITGQVIFGSTTFNVSVIGFILHIKTGSIAATAPVRLLMSEGLTPGGTLIIDQEMPVSQFPANSDVQVDLGAGFGTLSGNELTIAFVSEEDFSLLGNSSDEIFLEVDFQSFEFIEIETVNGHAVSHASNITGSAVIIPIINTWVDVDDGGVGLIWALAPSAQNFTLTNPNNGEITYNGLVDAGLRLGGSAEIGGMAGMDGVEIGISINGAAPTPETITCGFVTPVQLDSITISPAKIPVSIGDTLKLQVRNISNGSNFNFFQAKNTVF